VGNTKSGGIGQGKLSGQLAGLGGGTCGLGADILSLQKTYLYFGWEITCPSAEDSPHAKPTTQYVHPIEVDLR
jgi:hypothetical protein